MENKPEQEEAQKNPQEEETSKKPEEKTSPQTKQYTPEEIAELEKRASVSSQNFERLKKAEEEKEAFQRQLETLQTNVPSNDDIYSEEGQALKKQIEEQNATITALKEEREIEKVVSQFPILKDKQAEFDEFRKEYPRHKLENVAKLFLAENDLLETKRKGLEKPSGGSHTPPSSGKMSADDVKRLRETNYKKYMEMLQNGQIQIAE